MTSGASKAGRVIWDYCICRRYKSAIGEDLTLLLKESVESIKCVLYSIATSRLLV